jgi:mono/diheme cytochrome c family protein
MNIPRMLLPVFATLCILAPACGTFDYGDAPVDEVEVDVKNPEFALDIKPLMQLKCMNCHAKEPGPFAPGDATYIPLDVEAKFEALAARVEARVFKKPDDPMPPDFGTPLTDNERAALKKYLANLKTEVTPTPTPEPGEKTLTLSAEYTSEGCNGCHGPKGETEVGAAKKKLSGTTLTEAAFLLKVKEGGGDMPPYPNFPEASAKADRAAFAAVK